MKTLLNLLLTLLLTSSFACQAVEDAKRESVEQLLEAMDAQAIIDSMYSQIDKLYANMAQQLGVKESEQAIFKRFMSRVANAMREEMTWNKLKEPMIEIYMKHYTEKELEDLLAFYRTESGRSIVSKMPLVAQDSMLITQSMMQEFMSKVRVLSQALGEELKSARAQPQ